MNKIIDALIRRYRWYIADPLARRPFQNLKIMDSFESIQYIIDHRCSISRYGDGELALFWGERIGFQEVNDKLVSSLKRAASHRCPKPYRWHSFLFEECGWNGKAYTNILG